MLMRNMLINIFIVQSQYKHTMRIHSKNHILFSIIYIIELDVFKKSGGDLTPPSTNRNSKKLNYSITKLLLAFS